MSKLDNYDMTTALEIACYGGNWNIINMLLEKGAHITETCFYMAYCSGHSDIVRFILERNIVDPVKVFNQYSNSDLILTIQPKCSLEKLIITKELMKLGCPLSNQLFLNACYCGDLETVGQSMDYNDVQSITEHSYLCGLIIACEQGHTNVVKFILDRHATQVMYGIFEAACRSNNIEMVKLLFKYNVPSKVIDTCFHIPCENENPEMMRLLVQHGAKYCTLCDESVWSHKCMSGWQTYGKLVTVGYKSWERYVDLPPLSRVCFAACIGGVVGCLIRKIIIDSYNAYTLF
jgi:ankyrin repeat protein